MNSIFREIWLLHNSLLSLTDMELLLIYFFIDLILVYDIVLSETVQY